jgi:hypothetical protein
MNAVAAPRRASAAFDVLARKHDGREVVFQSYACRDEANRVAARLRAIGCQARVELRESPS